MLRIPRDVLLIDTTTDTKTRVSHPLIAVPPIYSRLPPQARHQMPVRPPAMPNGTIPEEVGAARQVHTCPLKICRQCLPRHLSHERVTHLNSEDRPRQNANQIFPTPEKSLLPTAADRHLARPLVVLQGRRVVAAHQRGQQGEGMARAARAGGWRGRRGAKRCGGCH